jgi:hypothetical protein
MWLTTSNKSKAGRNDLQCGGRVGCKNRNLSKRIKRGKVFFLSHFGPLFKVFWTLLPNLANPSYGWLPFLIHHKIGKTKGKENMRFHM